MNSWSVDGHVTEISTHASSKSGSSTDRRRRKRRKGRRRKAEAKHETKVNVSTRSKKVENIEKKVRSKKVENIEKKGKSKRDPRLEKGKDRVKTKKRTCITSKQKNRWKRKPRRITVETLAETAERRAKGLTLTHVRLRPNPKRYYSIFERKRAIRIVQRWIRNRLATRRERRILYVERRRQFAATALQAAFRGSRSRAQHVSVSKKRNAARRIQSEYRAHVVRNEMKQKNRAASRIQRRVRHRIREKEKVIRGRRRHDACVKIQRVCRGHRTRSRLEQGKRQRRAAVNIQRVCRGRAARRRVRKINTSNREGDSNISVDKEEVMEKKEDEMKEEDVEEEKEDEEEVEEKEDEEEVEEKEDSRVIEAKLQETKESKLASSSSSESSESDDELQSSDDDEYEGEVRAHDIFRTEF